VLEIPSFCVNARLQSLSKLAHSSLQRFFVNLVVVAGLLQRALQLLDVAASLLADFRFNDRPDAVVERIEIRTVRWPGFLPPELSDAALVAQLLQARL
jgi:protein involved in temperature-dependent protein secretion